MISLLAAALPGDISIILIAVIFIGCIATVFIFVNSQMKLNKAMREDLKADIAKTQEQVFSQAVEILVGKLTEYTDTVLTERVNDYYSELVARELFPAVNDASLKITQLSEEVIRRQESGMAELAGIMAHSLSDKVKDLILKENEILSSLNETTRLFSGEFANVTQTVKELSAQNINIYSQTKEVSDHVSKAASTLGGTVLNLTGILGELAHSIAQAKKDASENSYFFKELIETTAQVQKIAGTTAETLASQNKITADLLNNAVSSMQLNTEQAAKSVLVEFGANLQSTTDIIEGTVVVLKEIAGNISDSATQFSAGITNSYSELGSNLDSKLSGVAQAMSEAVNAEYQKITSSAENYSKSFGQSINKFNSTLEEHINGLQTITQQLNNNVASFKSETQESSTMFESGMDKSVSAALIQIDEALAEIVKRLVTVTVNIQEAADALPKISK